MPAFVSAGAEEKAPLPATQEEGRPPTSAIAGERRCKHSIIAQNAVGRDNFGFIVQRTPAVAATLAIGFLQEKHLTAKPPAPLPRSFLPALP